MINRPLRVLHVVERMNRAGVETWLMHLLRKMDRRQIAMDFLVHRHEEGHYDAELRALGARRFVCLSPRHPWRYIPHFRSILKHNGPFDVVHSHVDHFTGTVMKIAAWLRIPRRIAHSHNDTRLQQSEAGLLRSGYFQLMNHWIRTQSTVRFAASSRAATAMFSPQWNSDSHCRVLPYGLDWSSFSIPYDRRVVRAELAIPPDAWVIGHVGRFEEQKNHALLIKIFAGLCARAQNAHLLLIGGGPLRSSVETEASRLGLSTRVTFAGVRADVPRLMIGGMDCFLFPSLYEGLGIAALEAQAAGLPIVVSDSIPNEVDVAPLLLKRVGLTEPVSNWIESILEMRSRTREFDGLRLVRESSFSLESNFRVLEEAYS